MFDLVWRYSMILPLMLPRPSQVNFTLSRLTLPPFPIVAPPRNLWAHWPKIISGLKEEGAVLLNIFDHIRPPTSIRHCPQLCRKITREYFFGPSLSKQVVETSDMKLSPIRKRSCSIRYPPWQELRLRVNIYESRPAWTARIHRTQKASE